MPRVREHDRHRQADALDVTVERLEEALLLPARHERIDQADGVRRLEIGGAHLALVPLGVPRRPAPEPGLQLLHVHDAENGRP